MKNNYKHIHSLLFGKAEYYVGDANGNLLLMKINYKKGHYSLITLKMVKDSLDDLKNEAIWLADDLISRKSKINFAENNC